MKSSDFLEMLRIHHPHLLPDLGGVRLQGDARMNMPMGTTIVATKMKGGVVIAGDRRAVEGFQVGDRRIEKIFSVDDFSAVAIAGVAGPCVEMARVFQIQMEYHEKIEGTPLSFDGKANFLSALVRQNLQAALQGLIVMPIFVGYDPKRGEGRIFKYDLTGGRYEETDYYAIGSGGKDARGTLKNLYKPDLDVDSALRIVIRALWDASDEDIATGGPDFVRGIFPTIKLITKDGTTTVAQEKVAGLFNELIDELKNTNRE